MARVLEVAGSIRQGLSRSTNVGRGISITVHRGLHLRHESKAVSCPIWGLKTELGPAVSGSKRVSGIRILILMDQGRRDSECSRW